MTKPSPLKGTDLENKVPFFQPIICVDTRSVLGHEVLGREWVAGTYKSLGPFFHAPDTPQEEKIIVDRHLRERGLERMQRGPDHLQIFLNIQPDWIWSCLETGQDFPTVELIKKARFPGERVVIEITESEFHGDIGLLAEVMKVYRQAGFRIAIDDVGCGFSNLDRIVSLKPDFIKIDANLVREINETGLAFHMLESMALFAQRSGIDVIFEGIETREQFVAGLQAGARYYQGYLFARPQPELDTGDYLQLTLQEDFEVFASRQLVSRERQLELAQQNNRALEPLGRAGAAPCVETLLEQARRQALPPWFRLYICQENGYQVTPNYLRSHPGEPWRELPEYYNRYWGWRPYFIPLYTQARQQGRGILSEPYNDLESGQEICTFCYPLPGNLFLFIDLSLG